MVEVTVLEGNEASTEVSQIAHSGKSQSLCLRTLSYLVEKPTWTRMEAPAGHHQHQLVSYESEPPCGSFSPVKTSDDSSPDDIQVQPNEKCPAKSFPNS